MAWGVTMLQPQEIFQQPQYRYMADIGEESRWGLVAVLFGICRWFAFCINGWWRRTPLVRCLGSMAGGLFRLSIAFLMWAAARSNGAQLQAGIAYYPVFFGFEGWCVFAAGYDIQKSNALAWWRSMAPEVEETADILVSLLGAGGLGAITLAIIRAYTAKRQPDHKASATVGREGVAQIGALLLNDTVGRELVEAVERLTLAYERCTQARIDEVRQGRDLGEDLHRLSEELGVLCRALGTRAGACGGARSEVSPPAGSSAMRVFGLGRTFGHHWKSFAHPPLTAHTRRSTTATTGGLVWLRGTDRDLEIDHQKQNQ